MTAHSRVQRLISHISPQHQHQHQHQHQPNTLSSATALPCSSDEVYIRTHQEGRVGVITIDRQKALNALCGPLMAQMKDAVENFEKQGDIGCIIVTGAGRAFAAGADISEFQGQSTHTMTSRNPFKIWNALADCTVPTIAAVNGYAFGGGCEVAMMCDIMVASEKAKFGQPEIKLGLIPGAGGTQRLIRAVGKSMAMEMNLTGRVLSAQDALDFNLVSHVFAHDELMTETMKIANTIANMSLPVAKFAKEAVNAAYETTLKQGLHTEKKIFYSCFSLEDSKEGTTAFLNKRKAKFTHK